MSYNSLLFDTELYINIHIYINTYNHLPIDNFYFPHFFVIKINYITNITTGISNISESISTYLFNLNIGLFPSNVLPSIYFIKFTRISNFENFR